MRWARKRLRYRALWKSRELRTVSDQTSRIKGEDVLLFLTARNEKTRLPYFLDYYRAMGVSHFVIVDNGSDDGSAEYLADQSDVSLWTTSGSYKASGFGVDWLNHLRSRYGHGHWCLTVDADEFFQYPFCDTRPLNALTDWLDNCSIQAFSAILIDMYPKGSLSDQPYLSGQNPMDIACWFDSGNYMISRNPLHWNLWIQGGVRARIFFENDPYRAPALNKIPLVKWHKRFAYMNSTHALLPRGLNLVYDEWGGEKASGALLHAKFLDTFSDKAQEEIQRQEHYAESFEYRAYLNKLQGNTQLWCERSEKFINWRQLEILGLISKGNWA